MRSEMNKIINVDSISELHRFFGDSKPKHPLITMIDFTNPEFANPVSEIGMKYVLNFYCLSFKDFKGTLKYGRGNYGFEEGTIVFMSPGQVITIDEERDPGVKDIWGLFFHPDLIRFSTLAEKMKDYSFFNYESSEALHTSEKEKEILKTCLKNIEEEFSQNIDKHSQSLIVSNLELLLNYCTRFYDRQFFTRTVSNKDIVLKFEKYLKTYFDSEELEKHGIPSVKRCAEEMNLSPNYLSDLLKKETGKRTQEHIHFFLIEQAKNKLLSTTNPINDIAYRLGFEYPAYFTKVFKSKTGMSPSEYRQSN